MKVCFPTDCSYESYSILLHDLNEKENVKVDYYLTLIGTVKLGYFEKQYRFIDKKPLTQTR